MDKKFAAALELIDELKCELETGRLTGRSNAALYMSRELKRRVNAVVATGERRYATELEPGVEFRPAQSAPSVKYELGSRKQFDGAGFRDAMKAKYGAAVDSDIAERWREIAVKKWHFS